MTINEVHDVVVIGAGPTGVIPCPLMRIRVLSFPGERFPGMASWSAYNRGESGEVSA